jgi:hypothetical protein
VRNFAFCDGQVFFVDSNARPEPALSFSKPRTKENFRDRLATYPSFG